MAEAAGMPNWFESGSGVWSVATVNNGTPPCACAGGRRSSAKPVATRHMHMILHVAVQTFRNRDECGDRCPCMGTPSPRGKIRGSEHGYYHITLAYRRPVNSAELYHWTKETPIG